MERRLGGGMGVMGAAPAARRAVRRLVLALALMLGPGGAAAYEIAGSGVDVGGRVLGLGVVDTGGGVRQRPQLVFEPTARASVRRWLALHAALRTSVGGPFEGAHAGAFNLVHAFQDLSPSLEVRELYADVRTSWADVRAGIQTIGWGRLDGLPPTDVVNPRDFHDPFVRDPEDAKIGVPALAASIPLPDPEPLGVRGLGLSLVWVPLPVPSRLAMPDERWFPSAAAPVDRVVLARRPIERAIAAIAGQPVSLPGPVPIPITLSTGNHRPALTFDAGAIGARLNGRAAGVDWALYHYTGPETGPDLRLRSTLRLREFAVDPDTGNVILRLRNDTVLVQTLDRIHMTGADAAVTAGDFSIRAEAAYLQDRPYLRVASTLFEQDAIARLPVTRIAEQLFARRRADIPLPPLFARRDAVEWGIGADTSFGATFALLQLNQIVFVESTPRLVVGDPDTRLTATVRRPFFDERVELEVRGVGMLEKGGWFVFPRLTYRPRDGVRLLVGYLALGGPRTSLIGEFGRNDEVVFEARYTF